MSTDPGWPAGIGRLILGETDSTNAEALRQATAGAALPIWVMARRQTAGRGRRGRAWAAPEGNLAASLAMASPPPAEAALRGFTAGLALVDALGALGVDPGRLSLKWPNDVLLDRGDQHGGKLAGILLEGDGRHLVIGIGANLAAAPPAHALEPGALAPASLGGALAPEAVLDALAPAMALREAQLSMQGFAPIREDWLARAARLGQMVTARMTARNLTGRFETIDATGALILSTDEGRQAITAADIHFA